MSTIIDSCALGDLDTPVSDLPHTRRLRLLSYNIQVGIASQRLRHYITQSWRHVLPHPTSFENLDRIASLIQDYDMVALQEADGGSFRSYFTNQVEYLAKKGHFPFWHHQTNRNLGKLAQHSNGLLSKLQPLDVTEHKLPGRIPGRGVIVARYGNRQEQLIVVLVHLALGRRARMRQLEFISELINEHDHVVVMGDFNCQLQSDEMELLLERTALCNTTSDRHTFPSWRPVRKIDHILATPHIQIRPLHVALSPPLSDHLPVAVEIVIPDNIKLTSGSSN